MIDLEELIPDVSHAIGRIPKMNRPNRTTERFRPKRQFLSELHSISIHSHSLHCSRILSTDLPLDDQNTCRIHYLSAKNQLRDFKSISHAFNQTQPLNLITQGKAYSLTQNSPNIKNYHARIIKDPPIYHYSSKQMTTRHTFRKTVHQTPYVSHVIKPAIKTLSLQPQDSPKEIGIINHNLPARKAALFANHLRLKSAVGNKQQNERGRQIIQQNVHIQQIPVFSKSLNSSICESARKHHPKIK